MRMQTKINAFFKRQIPNEYKSHLVCLHDSDANGGQTACASDTSLLAAEKQCVSGDRTEPSSSISKSGRDRCRNTPISSKNPKNKRSYAQLHLDLGQSDFTLHSCSTCGFKYACGDEVDEKLHKELHKEYIEGIKFKGWENERVISQHSTELGRIILVLDGDPPAHKRRVAKVLQMMEVELGCSGNLVHKFCKVYLYVSRKRIAGCLVVEPISEAFRVLCKSETPRSSIEKKSRSDSSVLQFGSISFQREAKVKSGSQVKHEETEDFMGAILLETEPVPATCGIRAIWVAPATRRKHIATQLLDAARKTFSDVNVLHASQLAFSDPTSAGKILASRYCGTSSFLAYRAHS